MSEWKLVNAENVKPFVCDETYSSKMLTGDIIVIPPHCFHWIDNTRNDKPFRLFTFWPRQEQNGVYFERLKAWGTSVKFIDED